MSDSTAYIFDTNVISDMLRNPNSRIFPRIRAYKRESLLLCESVIYEVVRGLEHRQAKTQLAYFYKMIIPYFQVVSIELEDWQLAGVLWATARSNGKQLSDVDLVIGAVSIRVGGIIVSNDQDFTYIPVKLENWLR
jgi:tRNA(fMet)-specific endonuclease VapC